jgi:hypothetical protein
MPAARRISHTVEGATVTPSFVSSPWIWRCPYSGFSFARRTTRRAMPRTVGGRPGLRRSLVSCFFAAGLRCQASSVAGVTEKTSTQRLRGSSRASAAKQARSAGSYRTCLTCLHQQLGILRQVAAEHQDGQAEYPAREQVDDLEQHPASEPSPHQTCWRWRRSDTQSSIRAVQGAPAGEQRPLSIPPVRDRIVQAAAKIVLEPVFEADFLPCSFGFRPGRSQQDALQVLIEECAGPPVGGRDGHRELLFRDSAR